MSQSFENISVVIPVLDEVNHLPIALNSLLSGNYPKRNIEIIIVDGGSTDGTLTYVKSIRGIDITLIHNKDKTTPNAMNLGILAAKHSIILRADAHAVYDKDYIKHSCYFLVKNYGDNVGGVLSVRANNTEFSKVLAKILNSKIGNGGAPYRTAKNAQYVDTLWCGCWYKSTLIDVGMFDKAWSNNQDAELNARLIRRGYRIYCDPSIKAELVVRPTFVKMLKQYYKYGIGRATTFLRYPDSLSVRQVLPMVGVVLLTSLLLCFPFYTVITLLLAFLITVIYLYVKDDQKLGYFWFPVILLGMNYAWVYGFIRRLFEYFILRKIHI